MQVTGLVRPKPTEILLSEVQKNPQARLPSRYLSAYLVKELRFIFTASKVRFPS